MTAAERKQFCGSPDSSGLQGMLRASGDSGQDCGCSARRFFRSSCSARRVFHFPCFVRGCLLPACSVCRYRHFACSAQLRRLFGCSAQLCRFFVRFAGWPYCPSVLLAGLFFYWLVFDRQVYRWSFFSMSAPSEQKHARTRVRTCKSIIL